MDSLSQYLAEAARYPLLSKDQEIILARQVQAWKSKPDPTPREIRAGKRAYEKLVNCNLRLVVSVAKRYHQRTKRCHFLDIIQEGNMGLAHGVTKFDPERGYALSTYVYWWIRQAITRYLSANDRIIRIPGHTVEVLTKLRAWSPKFRNEHGREPTLQESAEFLSVSLERLEGYLSMANDCVSLDGYVRKSEPDSTLIDVVADQDAQDPLDLITLQLGYDQVATLLHGLDPTDRMIVERTFAFNGNEPATLQKIGTDLGISRERVRQRLKRTLLKLRCQFHMTTYDWDAA